jgi:glucokinase
MDDHSPLSIGIDLGGTSIRVGLYDGSLKLLSSRSMPTRVTAGPQACVQEMAEAARTLAAVHGITYNTEAICGIGIGSPGPINLKTGVLGLLPNLPGWDNFPLRDALAEAAALPVLLESDANAAALAEWKFGVGQPGNVDSMAMITLGTGVGSGIILNGSLWHGRDGMGGEVGHTTVDPDGPVCGCGSRGCLEMYASASGLRRLAQHAAVSAETSAALQDVVEHPDGFNPLHLAKLANHDPAARTVFHRFGYYLGLGIAGLLNTLDLPLVVVGGGVAGSWPLFAPSMFATVREYSVIYRLAAPIQQEAWESERIFICPATLGPAAGLMGAALLPHLALPRPFRQTLSYAQR